MPDLWEQLADAPVPPPPEKFDRGVHERINAQLLVGQVADFLFRCLPFAMWHFGRGLLGAVLFTLSGKFPIERKNERNDGKNEPGA